MELARNHSIELAPDDFFGKSVSQEITSEILLKATHWGELPIGDAVLPAYVLATGERVFAIKGVMVGLMEIRKGRPD